jgi:ATP-dependent DNA ligase
VRGYDVAWTCEPGEKLAAKLKHAHMPKVSESCTLRTRRVDGEALFRQACAMGLEGLVAKRRRWRYRSGPCRDWIKVKNRDAPAFTRVKDALSAKRQ